MKRHLRIPAAIRVRDDVCPDPGGNRSVPSRGDLERGREIGWDRVVAGLHHPTDIYAGRVLGQALAESLLADPKFQAELVQLKKEFSDAEQHAAEPVGASR